MSLQTKEELSEKSGRDIQFPHISENRFSKDYVEFLNDAGWKLEKKFPSNCNNYSDLLEDTDWKSNNFDIKGSIHYRRDLDALS